MSRIADSPSEHKVLEVSIIRVSGLVRGIDTEWFGILRSDENCKEALVRLLLYKVVRVFEVGM